MRGSLSQIKLCGIMKYQIFNSSDKNVSKFVFEKDSDGVQKGIAVEAVLYRYNSYEES